MASVGGIWGGNASCEKTRRICTLSLKFVFDFKQEMSMTIMHSLIELAFGVLVLLPDWEFCQIDQSS